MPVWIRFRESGYSGRSPRHQSCQPERLAIGQDVPPAAPAETENKHQSPHNQTCCMPSHLVHPVILYPSWSAMASLLSRQRTSSFGRSARQEEPSAGPRIGDA